MVGRRDRLARLRLMDKFARKEEIEPSPGMNADYSEEEYDSDDDMQDDD